MDDEEHLRLATKPNDSGCLAGLILSLAWVILFVFSLIIGLEWLIGGLSLSILAIPLGLIFGMFAAAPRKRVGRRK